MSTISSRDMERDGHKFLSFWTIFCRITPLTTQKIKILKKNFKKRLKIALLYKSVTKIMIICHTVPEIWRVADVIFIFHDGLFFCPFTPLKPKKSKFLKIGKNSWRYHFACVPKIMITWCTIPEICCATDRRTEKVTYRGGCPT